MGVKTLKGGQTYEYERSIFISLGPVVQSLWFIARGFLVEAKFTSPELYEVLDKHFGNQHSSQAQALAARGRYRANAKVQHFGPLLGQKNKTLYNAGPCTPQEKLSDQPVDYNVVHTESLCPKLSLQDPGNPLRSLLTWDV
ncbi:hypothetical protein PCANC_17882 [Puccinia coronata f. sp. avenae]|uniref:Uncharacterized protein n=1 Tax=Puccinia coronata f. sp. avenae TaxID=200324 RepID=A0A2N5SKM1_9BASI|nr:hypothetical protein PCANC_17882 [Puccinia coronata f. sp. avenae]